MATLNHPFIVHLVSVYKDDTSLYMLIDLLQGGELFSVLHTKVSATSAKQARRNRFSPPLSFAEVRRRSPGPRVLLRVQHPRRPVPHALALHHLPRPQARECAARPRGTRALPQPAPHPAISHSPFHAATSTPPVPHRHFHTAVSTPPLRPPRSQRSLRSPSPPHRCASPTLGLPRTRWT